MYVLVGAASGTQALTVTFATASLSCQFKCTEFYNVTGIDGTLSVGASTSSTSTISAGSITPSIANDLIYQYGYDAANVIGTVTAMTAITPIAGFTLLDSDIFQGTFAQYRVWPSVSSITPSVTLTGATDAFLTISVPLKSGSAGVPGSSAIRPVKVQTLMYNRNQPVAFPILGNASVVCSAFWVNLTDWTGVTNSNGDTYSVVNANAGPDAQQPALYYATNISANATNHFTLAYGVNPTADPMILVMYDIINAASNSYETSNAAGSITTNTSVGNFTCGSITTNATGSLIIAVVGTAEGYIGGVQQGTLDSFSYTGETGSDNMTDADGYAHYLAPSAGTVNFGWVLAADTSLGSTANPSENASIIAFSPGAATQVFPMPAASDTVTALVKPRVPIRLSPLTRSSSSVTSLVNPHFIGSTGFRPDPFASENINAAIAVKPVLRLAHRQIFP